MKRVLVAMAMLCVVALTAKAIAADDETKPENYVPNGSFEVATNPSFPDFWGDYGDANLVPFYKVQTQDNSTAVDGKWSHKIEAHYVDFLGGKTFRGSQIFVSFTVPAVTTLTDYVFTAYLKSATGGMQVSLGAGGKNANVTLTKEWQRYSVVVPLDEKSSKNIIASVSPGTEGTYWIDAVQFEKGTEPTPYTENTTYAYLYKQGSSQPAPDLSAFPLIKAAWSDSEPNLDGKIDDPIWQKAAHVTNFVLNKDAAPAKQQTEAWAVFTPTALCVAFKCVDDQMDRIKATVTKRNGQVWTDDCVELFLNSTNDPDAFFQFTLNTLNTHFSKKKDTALWDTEWKSAVSKGIGFWTAEMSIPLSALELDATSPAAWRINFCRENHKAKEYSQWSFTKGSFLTPTRFGRLSGIVPDKLSSVFWKVAGSQLQYKDPTTNLYSLAYTLENLTTKPQDVLITTSLSEQKAEGQTGQNLLQFSDQPIKLLPGAASTLSTDFKLDKVSSADYRMHVQVKDKKTNTVLYKGQDYLLFPDFFEAYFQHSFFMNETEAVVKANLYNCADSLLKNLSVHLAIDTPSGKIEKQTGFTQGHKTQISLDISKLSEGSYPATIELLGSSGTQISIKRDTLTKLPFKPYAVPLDRDTRTLLVEGKPFYPYMMTMTGGVPACRSMIPEVAAAGYNGIAGTFTLFSKIRATDEEIQAVLDDCQKYNLKFIFWMRAIQSDREDNWQPLMRHMEHTISKFREHPAIIAWWYADESWGGLGPFYQRCRELDPYRPVFRNTCWSGEQWQDTAYWLSVPDLLTQIYSGDMYPFGKKDPCSNIEIVADYADAMVRIAARSRMPLFMFCQGYGYGDPMLFREPTPDEQDAMLYLLKIRNFTGFYYFANRPQAKENWDAMSRIGKEFATLEPILLGADLEKQLRFFQPDIHATTTRHGDELYLLVAHAAPGACSFRIPLGTWGEKVNNTQAKVLFENREVTIKNGILSDSFPGYGRHAYLIKD